MAKTQKEIRQALVNGITRELKKLTKDISSRAQLEEVLIFAVKRKLKTIEQLEIMRAFGFRYG